MYTHTLYNIQHKQTKTPHNDMDSFTVQQRLQNTQWGPIQ